ncbi:hypothetical protein PAXRUDRAFT_135296, partial [Paxillus rubicundulus Ve08.2h10]
VKAHLEPLAVAANVTQSNLAQLDTVLATLVNLFQIFTNPSLDPVVCTAVCASLEKRWAKADHPIFILAMVFNPHIQVSAFVPNHPCRQFDGLWPSAYAMFVRFFNAAPNWELCIEFLEYIRVEGCWSEASLYLKDRQADADKESVPVNLLELWHEHGPIVYQDEKLDDSTPPNGLDSPVKLARQILSIVPNAAATEWLFNQFSIFGIVHSRLRNHLHPNKVCKQVLLKVDIIAKFGAPVT